MGVVVRAYDERLDRTVALKLLSPGVHQRRRDRLRREAQALARLCHPNVVEVYDVGEHDDQVYIAMELVEGQTLRQWQQHAPRDWSECVAVYLQAARGLAAAHAEGLVHRDFKPDNCILGEDGRVRVLDFGLVLDAGEPTASSNATDLSVRVDEAPADPAALTRTGAVLGTPAYMAPEQIGGRPADPRSDQFGFCVALYEGIYGVRPYRGETLDELQSSVAEGTLTTPPERSVPPRLRRVLRRGLARRSDDRWPSMTALINALERATRSRWPQRVGTVGVALCGIGLVAVATTREPETSTGGCGEDTTGLAATWNDERAGQVREAIEGTGLPYADETWTRVRAQLDRYAASWTQSHDQACQGWSTEDELFDRRMACLSERRMSLLGVVDVLAQSDAATVDGAVELVMGLATVDSCDDVDALARGVAPPDDPELAAQLPQLRQRLIRARTLGDAAQYDAALAEAESVATRAEALAHPPLVAEALLVRGIARAAKGRSEEGIADLEQAYDAAMAYNDDRLGGEAAIHLCRLMSTEFGRVEEAERWAKTALSFALRHGEGTLAEARAHHALGRLYFELERLDEAERELEASAAIRDRQLPPEHVLAGESAHQLGNVRFKRGDLDGAVEAYERALAIKERALGPGHPSYAGTQGNLGFTLQQLGRYDEAIAHMRGSLETRRRAHGPDHPKVATAINRLGLAMHARGEAEEAIALFEESVAIYERTQQLEHPGLANVLTNLGDVLRLQGRNELANRHSRRALEIYEQVYGPDHPLVGTACGNLGLALGDAGHVERGIAELSRAVSIFETRGMHADRAQALVGLALLYEGDEQHEFASTHVHEALTVLEEVLGPTHPALVLPLSTIADMDLARGELASAIDASERALALELDPANRARVSFTLARALWDTKQDRPRARRLAEQALEGFSAPGLVLPSEVELTRQWLDRHPR